MFNLCMKDILRPLAGKIILGCLCFIACIQYLSYLANVPFPRQPVFGSLAVIIEPLIRMGEAIYQLTDASPFIQIISFSLLFLILIIFQNRFSADRKPGRMFLWSGVFLSILAQCLYIWKPLSVIPVVLGIASVCLFISSILNPDKRCQDSSKSIGKINRRLLLAAVLLIAFIFRAYKLDTIPAGQAQHTAEWGMEAAMMARDYSWDIRNPIAFSQTWSHVKNYLLGPHQQGTNILIDWVIFSIWWPSLLLQRGVTSITGVLTVLILFLLAEYLFNTYTGFMASFLMAISPWHIMHSRYSSTEHAIAILFVTLSVYCVVRALREQRISWTILSLIVLSVDFFLYVIAQFIVFILIVFWLYTLLTQKRKSFPVFIGGVIFLVLLTLIISPKIGIFGFKEKVKLLNTQIEEHPDYQVQAWDRILRNASLTLRGLFLEGEGCAWFSKKGAYLMWPVSVALLGGISWCLPRFRDYRCVLLMIWFIGGIIPTIPSAVVAPRRILCANPAIYIIAASFIMVCASYFKAIPAKVNRHALQIAGILLMLLASSTAFATFRYHAIASEVLRNGPERRLAEIVRDNIQSYYTYMFFEPHTRIQKIWIVCGQYRQPGERDLPIQFFQKMDELPVLRDGVPGSDSPMNAASGGASLRSGSSGTLFLLPIDENGNQILESLRSIFPDGKHELYKYDEQFLNHDSGVELFQSYKIPLPQ